MKETPNPQLINTLVEQCQVSGNVSIDLKGFYELPRSFSDLRTLDIGAGVSDWTAWLYAQEADAIAIDPLFRNFDQLKQRYVDTTYRDATEAFTRAGREPLSRDDPRFVNFVFDKYWYRFEDSYINRRASYIPGSFHRLPFRDETFDLMFSFYGIFGVSDHDYSLLSASMQEALRVVKKGGKVQIAPALTGIVTEDQYENQSRIIQELRGNNNVSVELKSKTFGNVNSVRLKLLIITKI